MGSCYGAGLSVHLVSRDPDPTVANADYRNNSDCCLHHSGGDSGKLFRSIATSFAKQRMDSRPTGAVRQSLTYSPLDSSNHYFSARQHSPHSEQSPVPPLLWFRTRRASRQVPVDNDILHH